MAISPNNVANITTSYGSTEGDGLAAPYLSERVWTSFDAFVPTATDVAGVAAELVARIGTAFTDFENVGFFTGDGSPTASSPDTDDQTTTVTLWDKVDLKFGRSVISGRSFGFTLAETLRDSAWNFVNGDDSIDTVNASVTDYKDRGQNPTPQTLLIPCLLDNCVELIIIEKAVVTVSEDFTENENEPRVLGVTLDTQEGAHFAEKIVRRRYRPAVIPTQSQTKSNKED